MKNSRQRIIVDPEEILIENLEVSESHVEMITVTNSMSVPVTIEFSPHTTIDRKHEISPSVLRLESLETTSLQIKTTLIKYPKYGHIIRDLVYIKSEHFIEKFYISIETKNFSYQENSLIERELGLSRNSRVFRMEEEIKEYQNEIERLNRYIDEKNQVENDLERLKQENNDLKVSLEDANRGSFFSQKITDMYKEKASVETVVEMRLQEEKEKNERKDAKVLQILKQKDATIQVNQEKLLEQEEKIAELHSKLVKTKTELESSENSKNSLEKSLKASQESLKALKSQQESLKISESSTNQKENSQIKKLQEEVQRLKNREEGILSLSSKQLNSKESQEKILKEKDQLISDLLNKVSFQSNYIESLSQKFLNTSHSEILSTVLRLEQENKLLCAQIAESIGKSPSEFVKVYQNNENMAHELDLKNREIIELQNRIISLQQKPGFEENDKIAANEREKVFKLEFENEKLKELITGLEQSNKDLQNELGTALKGINAEAFTQNIASQTQLVSRLNARVMNLKERDEAALKKLEESEETIKELKKLIDDEKSKKTGKTGKSPEKKTFKAEFSQTEEKLKQTDTFELERYEIKIGNLSKEVTEYQNKYYEVLKSFHQAKAENAFLEASHVEEISKIQRENILLGKDLEKLQDLTSFNQSRLKSYGLNSEQLLDKVKMLETQILSTEDGFKSQIEELEGKVLKLKVENDLKESCVQERTAQVAILFEKLEGNTDKDDLAIKVSHFKAVEGSLNRQIIEFKSTISRLNQQIEIESKKKQKYLEKEADFSIQTEKYKKTIEESQKIIQNLSENLESKESDAVFLTSQLSRYQENEKDYKSRIDIYIKQINSLQSKNAEDIIRERQAFQEEILRIKEEIEPFDYELQYDRPLILALNQLTISLKNLAKQASSEDFIKTVDKMKEIVLTSDKEMFTLTKKNKELEFLLKTKVFYKFLNCDSMKTIEKLKGNVFALAEEAKI